MRFTSIASGSSGNCTYIGSDNTHILIDAGVSKKRIEEGLKSLDLTLSDISAIFVTHEHTDHIAALHTILKKFDIPIYATGGTIQGIKASDKKAEMINSRFVQVMVDKEVLVGDMKINPMTISHDANEPCGYTVVVGDKKVGVATDLGCYDDYIVKRLSDCDSLLLEANHDIRMLQTGPYPYVLKARILGDKGHLCNEKSGELLGRLINNKLQGVFLGHLSKENNLPELAYEAVRVELQMNESLKYNDGFPIMVADRSSISTVLEF
ncbi:Phosphoribosyl 1,2-cyclic phosphodiesterase [Butyrivibrio proteoclasticus]|uniref:Phosphoribosyl 1,2-cyclic phosphodiesterase n=1 Tax=Butyrivibrio proteoclasticus TaxID=43305 RepID=A0A1I5UAY3_9FIRM|nr:MBL fold metallo-hydrolase [Butyrivibrio proteoclasticus]SFP92378.1 Phosphoribosyl 1,2-cyclic phosphodiesterase [Butyrivibrio proteoclasticus]